MTNSCCMSSEYISVMFAIKALATIKLSQYDNEYCWRNCDARINITCVKSMTR